LVEDVSAIVGSHRIATDRRELRPAMERYVRVRDLVIVLSQGFPMRTTTAPPTIRVHEPVPLGDVSLAPRELTGVSQAELARSMAEYLVASTPGSDAQALGSLRRAFPFAPLTARVAALAALIRR
jgi:hypothetical protein